MTKPCGLEWYKWEKDCPPPWRSADAWSTRNGTILLFKPDHMEVVGMSRGRQRFYHDYPYTVIRCERCQEVGSRLRLVWIEFKPRRGRAKKADFVYGHFCEPCRRKMYRVARGLAEVRKTLSAVRKLRLAVAAAKAGRAA